MKKLLLCSTFCLLPFYLSAEVRLIPVADVSVLGGQYFLEGESASLGGNVSAFVVPTINFSPKTALLPMLNFNYRGTKDVEELVGGGTLTQQSLDIGPLSLKLVHKFDDTMKGKLRLGYKVQYLKETEDEKWGEGLFDYGRTTLGFEFEKMLKKVNLKLGFDYYTMRYPNYSSLISESGFETSIDTTTYTEISENAGENVLDYNAVGFSIEGNKGLNEKLSVKASYGFSRRGFADQSIVNENGSFKDELRKDNAHNFDLGLTLNTGRTSINLIDTIQLYSSNQNSYDAGRTKYIPDFYSFFQNGFSPVLSVYLGKAKPYKKLSLFLDVSYRSYSERLSQDSEGNYRDEKIHQNINTVGLGFVYPLERLSKGLSFRVNTNYRTCSSNMKYEENYRYNYYTFNYFAGVEFEY